MVSRSVPCSAVIRFEALVDGEPRAVVGVDFSPAGALALADVARCQDYLLDKEALRRHALDTGLGVGQPFVECVLKTDAASFDFIPIGPLEPGDKDPRHLEAY